MWIVLFAFGASFLLILTGGILMFYRSDANRRLSQFVVSHGQTAVLAGMTGESPSVARIEKLLFPFQGMLPRSPTEVSNLKIMLARGGYREARHVNTYYASKVLAPISLCLLTAAAGSFGLSPLFAYTGAIGLGFLIPDFWLSRLISRAADQYPAGPAGSAGSAGGVRGGRTEPGQIHPAHGRRNARKPARDRR